MAKASLPCDQLVEEDYIDMDINSTAFFCYTKSPSHPRDFEFQMSFSQQEIEPLPSPADELFYKGKLLPLHLPPRLQMVEKLLLNQSPNPKRDASTTAITDTTASTPFESCNVSPAASCYVSGELNPEGYFQECPCPSAIVQSSSKKSWAKKLKLMRQSSLGLKLKASKAYLKSLFTKSGCSDEPCAVLKAKESSSGFLKTGKKSPHMQIQSSGSKITEEGCGHRRSFSGAIKPRQSNKSSSASSCSSSNSSSFSSLNSDGPPMLKRSSSVNSDVENSIQGAIAYCKKSQQVVSGRKSVSDVGFCSLAASRIAAECEIQERPGLCRG